MKYKNLLSTFGLLFGITLTACSLNGAAQQAVAPSEKSAESSQPENLVPKTHSLAIVGYNYTDRYMDSVFVNGQGAGNLDISTPTAGGGSSMCCVSWRDGSKLPKKIKVQWVAAYCMQILHGSEGETQTMRQPMWKSADVDLYGPVPAIPQNLEVHFYPDGHIELAMTEGDSPPRLTLQAPPNGYIRPGIVINDPPCPKDYDRARARDNATKVNATGGKQP